MLELVERGFFRSKAITLTDPATASGTKNPSVQVLRVGKFNHPKYGEFEITTATLQELKRNFDSNIRGIDIAVDYFHKSDEEAAGWVTELFLAEDDTELWANVDWTKNAIAKFDDREIRYFSPDFAFKWDDPETGKSYKNVLFGGGLTNRPFVKDMAAIVAAEGNEAMKLEELEKKVLKLAEDGGDLAKKHGDLQKAHADLQAKHDALTKKMAEYDDAAGDEEPDEDDKETSGQAPSKGGDDMMKAMQKKLDEVDGRNKQLEKELMEMKEGKKLSERTAQFNVLLSEGKACAAQKDSFMKGDMDSFVKLSQPVNLSGHGHANVPLSTGEEDRADRVLKLAEKIAREEKIELVDAITKAHKTLKD